MRERFLDKMFWVKALFFVLAVLTGGAAMAVEIGENGSDTDPNDGKPLENATPDAAGKGIDQQGQGATGSAVTDADLAENKVEDYVSKFQAYKYPMHTDFLKLAKQVHVNTKEPEHYNIGEAIMDCVTKAAVTNTEKDAEVKLSLYKNDEKLFAECNTVLVDGVTGYDENGNEMRSPASEIHQANTANKENNYLSFNVGATLQITKDWKFDIDYTYAGEDQIWKKNGTKFTAADTWTSPVKRLKRF